MYFCFRQFAIDSTANLVTKAKLSGKNMSTATKKYDFTGKVALVTGSSSGIGAAIAIQLAQYGAQVTITGRVVENLEKVAEEIEAVSGEKPLQVIGDLLDQTLAPKLVNQTISKYGRLDILVNNAGGGDPGDGPFDKSDLLDAYDKVMGLNVRSVLQLIQLSVPHLEKTKGNIINISSVASIIPWSVVYSTSKAALDMLTRTTASQLAAKGIRVNSINPGPVKTAIYRSRGLTERPKAQDGALKKFAPLGEIAQPEDIANLASFLASDDAKNMTGSIVVSDSGMMIRNRNS